MYVVKCGSYFYKWHFGPNTGFWALEKRAPDHEELIRFTSDSSEHFKIIQISNMILVSFIKTTRKVENPLRKGNFLNILTSAKVLSKIHT